MGVEQYQSKWAFARCANLTPKESDATFFVNSGRPKKVPAHKQFCDSCPIVNFCLSYAIVHDEEGIWGGMTKNQRDSLGQDVKERLTVEAKLQGWYEERPSIDSLIRLMIESQTRREIEAIEIPADLEFDLWADSPVYDSPVKSTEQIQSVPCKPQDQQLTDAHPVGSDNGQYEDSSEFLFGIPSPSHDNYQSNKQPTYN